MQYDELRRKRADCYGISSPILSDRPRGGAKTSIVERQADRAEKYNRKIEAIEKAAMIAAGGCMPIVIGLLDNVARGLPYERISVPCGRRQFYNMRAVLFCELDKLVD